MKSTRRDFIKASILSGLGYSLICNVDAGTSSKLPICDISKKLDEINNSAARDFNESSMYKSNLTCDILIAGGGLAGICAAISAARLGKKVILVQDRSRLGGCSSSEIRMHPLGVHPDRTGWREGGIIEELRLENAAKNPQMSWEMWDFILYDKCVSEKNITLILDTSICGADVSDNEIKTVYARSDTKLTVFAIKAKFFVDATGDARLAMESKAELMSGRDGVGAYGESLASYDKVGSKQGSTILFTSRVHSKEMPFTPPSWAKKLNESHLKRRMPLQNELSYGYWWIELGGRDNAILDTEMLRFELLSVVFGVWDFIKNSGKYPQAKNRSLEWVGMLPGRRDTYRIRGERLLTQDDIGNGWKNFDDSVCVGGWDFDDHPAGGFYDSNKAPFKPSKRKDSAYNLPISAMYAKGLKNLFMAGRNISCSHVAFTSVRVMCTCAVMGQAVGACASMCIDEALSPSEFRAKPKLVEKLQQQLLRDDQTILNIKNEDSLDLARIAKLSASSSVDGTFAENVINGVKFDGLNSNKNKWQAYVADKPKLIFEWDKAQDISQVDITFDSGESPLTMTLSDKMLKLVHTGAQPSLVKDYKLWAIDEVSQKKLLLEVKGNYQRLNRHRFERSKVKSLILEIGSTCGSDKVGVFEVRAYA